MIELLRRSPPKTLLHELRRWRGPEKQFGPWLRKGSVVRPDEAILIAVASLIAVAPSNARGLGACELVQIFSSSNLLSKATLPAHDGFDGYDFLLVLNDARDERGILNSYIKGVLKPARWGFDVELPSGKRVGQVMLHVVVRSYQKALSR